MFNSVGATIWGRKTIESDIFFSKPDKWFKIWFFIVTRVNHKENKQFKRGECFTNYREISQITGATNNQIDSFMQWSKEQAMLTTRKTTRGMILILHNYDKYQDFKTYITDTETETKPKQNRNETDTINNNDNNVTNTYTTPEPTNLVEKLWNKFQVNPLLEKVKQKYPDRDYHFYFLEMCDWYKTKKKKLPQNISALSRWLSKTPLDEELRGARLRKLSNEDLIAKQKEMLAIPQNLNKLDEMKLKLNLKSF